MAIEDEFQDVVDTWRQERSKLEALKARKASIQSELALINEQITAQQPIVVLAKQAIKVKVIDI